MITSIKFTPEQVAAMKARQEERLNMTMEERVQEIRDQRQARQQREVDQMFDAWDAFFQNLLRLPLTMFRRLKGQVL